jgi:assimilatory nitrate reductase catalytic subunit
MNPKDAQRLRLKPHDRVNLVSRRGCVQELELRVTEIIAPGQLFMPFHFVETNANQITQSAFDPISREPNYKQSAVRVELARPAGQQHHALKARQPRSRRGRREVETCNIS